MAAASSFDFPANRVAVARRAATGADEDGRTTGISVAVAFATSVEGGERFLFLSTITSATLTSRGGGAGGGEEDCLEASAKGASEITPFGLSGDLCLDF